MLESDTPRGLHGLPLPEGATTLGVWALPTNPRPRPELSTPAWPTVTADTRNYRLGTLDSSDWQYLEADLVPERVTRFGGLALKPPLRLISLTIRQQRGRSLVPGAVYLDDLQAGSPGSSQRVIFHTFEDVDAATVIVDTQQAAADSLENSDSIIREGRGSSGVFIWGSGSLFSIRGLSFGDSREPDVPLRGIASRTLLENEGVSRGDTLLIRAGTHVTPVEIAEVADFFPTLDPFNGGFLVVNLPALLERLNTLERSIEHHPSELWVATPSDGPHRASLAQALGDTDDPRTVDRLELLESFRADPLVAAGWDGILTIAFIAVVFVTLVGFSVYSFVQGQRRRLEFAMLRSIGLSFRGLVGIVLLEQLAVIAVGLALGSWLGIQLTSILMPFLGLNESGSQVLPPFAVRVDWTAVLVTYGIMAVVFLVATVSLIGFFSRMAIQQVLRFGEV